MRIIQAPGQNSNAYLVGAGRGVDQVHALMTCSHSGIRPMTANSAMIPSAIVTTLTSGSPRSASAVERGAGRYGCGGGVGCCTAGGYSERTVAGAGMGCCAGYRYRRDR